MPTNFQRRSPLKFDEHEELISVINEQIKLGREVEDAKILLASQPDFNLMDAFQMIDVNSKGWITAPELTEALSDYGSFPHKNDVYLFVRRYDRDSDGRLLYSDFCDAFTPKDLHAANTMSRRQAYHLHHGYCREHYFVRETRDLFMRTFRTHFNCEESAELLRKRLSRRPKFSVHDAFTTVDADKNGYITREEFKKLLNESKVYVTDKELQSLVDRYDKNADGRVSYSEFMEELLPRSPSKI